MTRSATFSLLFICLSSFLSAENIAGIWKKVDEPALIEIEVKKGVLNGKIAKVSDPKYVYDEQNPNKALRGEKLLGLTFIKGFQKKGDTWSGGTVYDAYTGKVYKGKIWINKQGQLIMRGYVGISALGKSVKFERAQ